MAQLPEPANFRITNRDTSPSRKVRIEWDSYTGGQLAGIQLIGFRLFRSTTPGFTATGETAGSGNCIVDETTLDENAVFYEDGNIPSYGIYYYEIQAIGRFGYGLGPYGNGSPYGAPAL